MSRTDLDRALDIFILFTELEYDDCEHVHAVEDPHGEAEEVDQAADVTRDDEQHSQHGLREQTHGEQKHTNTCHMG